MGTLLEETKISDVSVAELDALVGREENQRLELKETLEGIDSYELAKDLSSMANAKGGYFVIGAAQDKNTERCTGFRSVGKADPVFKKIKDIAAEHIQDRLATEPVLRTTSTGENLILVVIPKALSPLAVTFDGRTEYWVRIGRDKRRMTHGEITAAFQQGMTNTSRETERQRRLAGDPSRWDQITSPEILWEVLDKRFEVEVGSQRYLRLTSTPEDLREDRVYPSNTGLLDFVRFPEDRSPGQRPSGVNLLFDPSQPLISTPLGWESPPLKPGGFPSLWKCLTRTGHYEVWIPLYGLVCVDQDSRDFRERPWLQPMAVNAFPVSFLRFIRALYDRLEVNSRILVRMQYRNLKGCFLPPGTGQGLIRSQPHPYRDQHFGPYDVVLPPGFEPDAEAFRLAQRFYRIFGYEDWDIPYFHEGRFAPR